MRASLNIHKLFAGIFITLVLGSSAFAVDADIERKIVDAYSDGRCSEIPKLIDSKDFPKLRPNVLATVAACELPGQNSEKLFELAEKQDNEGDLVAVLHAFYLYKRNPEAAKAYWNKVLLYSRSDALRDMAREAISGLQISTGPLNLSPWTWTAQAQVGGSYHSSPWNRDIPESTPDAGTAADYDLSGRLQRWIRPGSLSLIYRLRGQQYPDSQRISWQDQYAELPIALRVGKTEDFVIRPFFDHYTVGNRSFDNMIGIGFSGISYGISQKETVSGYAATQNTQRKTITSTQSAHYHFDYQWEWFPNYWLVFAKFGFDNISASRIPQYRTLVGDFNTSHNDTSINVTARRAFPHMSVGLTTAGTMRFDSHDSTWTAPYSHQLVTDTRNDYTLDLEPHVVFRIIPKLWLQFYFRRSWVWSSWSQEQTGFNLSHTDSVIGLNLRTYWSSY